MLSRPIQQLLERYKEVAQKVTSQQAVATIHVDEVASRVALFYEKTRNLVDYQEEHLIRKTFILRTIRRRLFVSQDTDIAESIIKELIRAGHLPNDAVPETKIAEAQRIIDAHHEFSNQLKALHLEKQKQNEAAEWLLHIAANAIEETLFPPTRDDLLLDLMLRSLNNHLSISGERPPEDGNTVLPLFVGVQKGLLRADQDQLQYRLMKLLYPRWNVLGEDAGGADFIQNVPDIIRRLGLDLKNPLIPAFLKLCNHYNTVYFLIGDIIDEAGNAETLERILSDEDELERRAKTAYDRRFKRERGRLRRMAFFSVISFFLSKIAVALAIEIPIERHITDTFSLSITVFSILFPPLLMLLITALVRMPSARNFDLLLDEIKKVTYENMPKEYAVALPKKKSLLVRSLVGVFYFATFVVSFYLLTEILLFFDFGIANIVIFTFFTSLVAATGVKIRNRSREISLEKERATVGSFLLDLFVMPFVTVGQWVIAGLLKFNVIVLAINLFIELPFQVFIEFLENLRGFIALKKEEIS
ncbi:MAG: hypothetical protein A2939_00720 [Parcubacteria group bacterium RIFCSPLOWO2_01_FULL_48_18]|nr:MAG: hypothetical protein A3J67_01510 [Parcubacteria group bacterium RIFCSPHIGHO2_02_FULL_48_10b]OHB22000.1 MAG: hypothetical protein A2939_00720 [Parcubacteria group bacterium RIFCSPLOWO2_01_FULL_48_18]